MDTAKQNVIGQRFGLLTITRHAIERGARFYEARCNCGGQKTASIHDMRRGFTTSCGCVRREALRLGGLMKKTHLVNDLTGRRFGMLVVKARSKNNKHGCTTWLCACDCGGSKVTSGNHLVTGNTASCGCAYQDRLAVRPKDRRDRSNNYVKNRYRTDVRYALNRRALHLIHSSLKARNSKKSERWEALVGYSLDDLLKHLHKTIPTGYTWQDFLDGKLHLEHKIPLAAFNFGCEIDLDFRRAWSINNLRLLPGPDNLSKGSSMDEPFQPSLRF